MREREKVERDRKSEKIKERNTEREGENIQKVRNKEKKETLRKGERESMSDNERQGRGGDIKSES